MMPNWPEDQKTHLMMYKTINGAGFPITPKFKHDAKLAKWLEENHVLDEFIQFPFLNWIQVIKVGSVTIFVRDYNDMRSSVKVACDY